MDDTIAAVATAASPAGIGIIRISGPGAFDVAGKLFVGENIGNLAANTINYGHIEFNGEILDEVLLSVFKAPKSYTGEDIIEINCHGGVLVVKSVLKAVTASGARLAGPGEFTKRAFLNGRLDLSEAESVMDVISAKSEYALQSAVSQLRGSLNEKIEKVRGALLYELAYIESALDDPEHISLDGYPQRLLPVVEKQLENLDRLGKTFQKGRYIEEGIKTVILGRPNVGKSSLLNMLSGKQRAIVTDIPGTTRDVLEETVNLGRVALKILDTAGIHDARDEVERIGVRLAWEKADEADLILYVIDGSVPLEDKDVEILKQVSNKKGIVLLNKSDLEARVVNDDVRKITRFPIVETSAKTGDGEGALQSLIEEMFFNGEISFNEEVFITNARHAALINEAIEALRLVVGSIEADMPEDFFAIDLRGAIDALDRITGDNLSEDLVDEIFSGFCMGK